MQFNLSIGQRGNPFSAFLFYIMVLRGKAMSVTITEVREKSISAKKRLKSGYEIISINENEINDFLDYRFQTCNKLLKIKYRDKKGKEKSVKIHKDEDEDIGLEFSSYLMDKQQRCTNKCIFCFIDQLPSGMRESLYFKDDDARLSFLFGNYITLTNLSQKDVDRIIKMRISPVNISVHTMNEKLRVEMMKNPKAGENLKYIKQFADAGIKLNTQLVLCPGYNDKKELEYSIEKLSKMYPSVQSIAAVPVGITKHRHGLCDLKGFDKETASDVIDITQRYSKAFLEKYKTRLVFAADEFYLKSEREIPDSSEYEDYPQIENGVGLWADFKSQFIESVNETDYVLEKSRHVTIATGTAAYPLICELACLAMKKYKNLKVDVEKIINNYFGETITVSGLITGQDLTAQLNEKKIAKELFISSSMLRKEKDMFLDSMTVKEVEDKLGVTLKAIDNDGMKLLSQMLCGEDVI